jgi:hypothetical protein
VIGGQYDTNGEITDFGKMIRQSGKYTSA